METKNVNLEIGRYFDPKGPPIDADLVSMDEEGLKEAKVKVLQRIVEIDGTISAHEADGSRRGSDWERRLYSARKLAGLRMVAIDRRLHGIRHARRLVHEAKMQTQGNGKARKEAIKVRTAEGFKQAFVDVARQMLTREQYEAIRDETLRIIEEAGG